MGTLDQVDRLKLISEAVLFPSQLDDVKASRFDLKLKFCTVSCGELEMLGKVFSYGKGGSSLW